MLAAVEPTFVAQPLKDALGCMTLLARARFVFGNPLVNLIYKVVQLWALDCSCPTIPPFSGM